MSLFTKYSTDNRIVETGLLVTYSHSAIGGSWIAESLVGSVVTATYDRMKEYHRRATMSLRYIAMTEEAAKGCVKDMVAKFTRKSSMSVWNPNYSDNYGNGSFDITENGDILMADIARQRNEDGSWDVVVNVNEDDVRLRKLNDPISAEVLFAEEMKRDYDGEEEETNNQQPSTIN